MAPRCTFIIDPYEVQLRAKEFYQNELALARNLVSVFERGELKRDLNQLVYRGMHWLEQQEQYEKALIKALDEEKSLTLWETTKGTNELLPGRYGRNPGGVKQACLAAQNGALKAPYCSDLIRLMGTIVEEGKKLELPPKWAVDEFKKKEDRRTPAPLSNDDKGNPLPLALTAPATDRTAMVWGDQKRADLKELGEKGKGMGPVLPGHEGFRDEQGLSGGDWVKKGSGIWEQKKPGDVYQGRMRGKIEKGREDKKLSGYEDQMVHAWFRGLLLKEAKGSMPDKYLDKDKQEQANSLESVVGKMERAFGYPAEVMGADISGTTADSTYVVENFAPQEGLDPIMYLLPFATIVAGGHHHLLEVAATLTLYGKIDYTVGLYDTILPGSYETLSRQSRYHNEVKWINSLVQNATRIAKDLLMLVYWPERATQPVRAVQLVDSDDWKKVAQLAPAGGASLWDLFLRVSPNPTLPDIRDLLRNRGCPLPTWMEVQQQINATLPKKFKLAA